MNQGKLGSCAVCGKKVLKAAALYPHCGDPIYQGRQLAGCGQAVMNLVIIVGTF